MILPIGPIVVPFWDYLLWGLWVVISSARGVLKGSWDLVSGVLSKVSTVIITYNPIKVLITLLTKSHVQVEETKIWGSGGSGRWAWF